MVLVYWRRRWWLSPGTSRQCERRSWTIRRGGEDQQMREEGNLRRKKSWNARNGENEEDFWCQAPLRHQIRIPPFDSILSPAPLWWGMTDHRRLQFYIHHIRDISRQHYRLTICLCFFLVWQIVSETNPNKKSATETSNACLHISWHWKLPRFDPLFEKSTFVWIFWSIIYNVNVNDNDDDDPHCDKKRWRPHQLLGRISNLGVLWFVRNNAI